MNVAAAHLVIERDELLQQKAKLDEQIASVEKKLEALGEKVGRKPSSLKGKKLQPKPCPAKDCKSAPNTRRVHGYYCPAHQKQHTPKSKKML